jgi:REP element-mobilizing transposase RayT
MVVAHHLIWTAYGWWLPNDPRGSSSHEIRVERIAGLGQIHHGRKPVQPPASEIREFNSKARDALAHEPLTFTDEEIEFLGAVVGTVIRERGYTCYECAIMPDHVHLLIRRHRDWAELMIQAIQQTSRQALIDAGRRAPTHPVWGGPGWKVFLNTPEDIVRVIKYIRDNPVKAGRPRQSWPFVQTYSGWMPRPARGRGLPTQPSRERET